MADCEFRLGSVVMGGIEVVGVGEVSVATSTGQPICRVKAVGGDQVYPVCELPEEHGETCPIAKFVRGEITLGEANQRLTEIFNSRRSV